MRICSTCGERNEDWMDICQRCGNSIVNAEVDNSYAYNDNYSNGNYPNDNYSNENYDDGYNANGYYSGPVSGGEDRSYRTRRPIENLDLKIILTVLVIILLCLIGYIIFFS